LDVGRGEGVRTVTRTCSGLRQSLLFSRLDLAVEGGAPDGLIDRHFALFDRQIAPGRAAGGARRLRSVSRVDPIRGIRGIRRDRGLGRVVVGRRRNPACPLDRARRGLAGARGSGTIRGRGPRHRGRWPPRRWQEFLGHWLGVGLEFSVSWPGGRRVFSINEGVRPGSPPRRGCRGPGTFQLSGRGSRESAGRGDGLIGVERWRQRVLAIVVELLYRRPGPGPVCWRVAVIRGISRHAAGRRTPGRDSFLTVPPCLDRLSRR
jgi:hypothetical protein